MLAKVYSCAVIGLDGAIVEVATAIDHNMITLCTTDSKL
jgi:hypothetical protein